MIKPTYVVTETGFPLPLTSGEKVVAIRPCSKGQPYSMCLTDQGHFVPLKGQRFGGVGIERYIKEHGYIEAANDNHHVAVLLDYIAAFQSIELVESASKQQAQRLQQAYANQRVSYVPFDPLKPIQTADVSSPDGFSTFILGVGIGITCGCVNVKFDTDATRKCHLELSNGWIAGPDVDPGTLPRATAYGGIVETAAFIIANAGLAKVSGSMEIPDGTDLQEPFPRGRMRLTLMDSADYINIGITVLDDLVVEYRRANGDLVCERKGLVALLRKRLVLADAVGCIAAVILQEQFRREGNKLVSTMQA